MLWLTNTQIKLYAQNVQTKQNTLLDFKPKHKSICLLLNVQASK